MHRTRSFTALFGFILIFALLAPARAQDKSVKPGINKQYENPNADEWAKKWETESREIFALREKIVAACEIKPGMAIADVGAGSGLFTRLFAKATGETGKVYAVDIAKNFIDRILKTSEAAGLKNVTGILCTEDDSKLPADSVDLVFICDTYHHFEYPVKTMASIQQAVRKGGRLVLIDFRRIPGQSKEWILKHVRAGQEDFSKEIETAGFKRISVPEELNKALKENYCVIFEKVDAQKK